ncbi:MAG: hypothetical protein DI640_13110 [Sphingomonas taxi]|uniref:Uncharacterized protein n=1 Tax=Sphingomonas taxi TaxID=1549858 RepID=A0A2W4YTA4_9SPHN|nr:MAG: hypothetical protein DI640_13110 [Sphingomonas taxi]
MQIKGTFTLPLSVLYDWYDNDDKIASDVSNRPFSGLVADYIQQVGYDDEGFGGYFRLTSLELVDDKLHVGITLAVDGVDVMSYTRMYVQPDANNLLLPIPRNNGFASPMCDLLETLVGYVGGDLAIATVVSVDPFGAYKIPTNPNPEV